MVTTQGKPTIHFDKKIVALIKHAEAGLGIRSKLKNGKYRYLTCHLDPVGVPTIGWGHTKTVTKADVGKKTITVAEAEELLMQDMLDAWRQIMSLVKKYSLNLNKNHKNALLSWVFNLGIGRLETSTAFSRMRDDDFTGAAEALTWYNKGRVNGKLVVLNGLTSRRASEKALFLTPVKTKNEVVDVASHEEARVTDVEENPPRRENIAHSRTLIGAGVWGLASAFIGIPLSMNLTAEYSAAGASLSCLGVASAVAVAYSRVDDWLKFKR